MTGVDWRFRSLVAAYAVSAYGNYLNLIALSLFSYEVTGTAFGLGLRDGAAAGCRCPGGSRRRGRWPTGSTRRTLMVGDGPRPGPRHGGARALGARTRRWGCCSGRWWCWARGTRSSASPCAARSRSWSGRTPGARANGHAGHGPFRRHGAGFRARPRRSSAWAVSASRSRVNAVSFLVSAGAVLLLRPRTDERHRHRHRRRRGERPGGRGGTAGSRPRRAVRPGPYRRVAGGCGAERGPRGPVARPDRATGCRTPWRPPRTTSPCRWRRTRPSRRSGGVHGPVLGRRGRWAPCSPTRSSSAGRTGRPGVSARSPSAPARCRCLRGRVHRTARPGPDRGGGGGGVRGRLDRDRLHLAPPGGPRPAARPALRTVRHRRDSPGSPWARWPPRPRWRPCPRLAVVGAFHGAALCGALVLLLLSARRRDARSARATQTDRPPAGKRERKRMERRTGARPVPGP